MIFAYNKGVGKVILNIFKKVLAKYKNCAIIVKQSETATIYRGVEQLVARRAHNPKVAGSSPVSATKRSSGVAVNMPACHAGDRGFDSLLVRHLNSLLTPSGVFFYTHFLVLV